MLAAFVYSSYLALNIFITPPLDSLHTLTGKPSRPSDPIQLPTDAALRCRCRPASVHPAVPGRPADGRPAAPAPGELGPAPAGRGPAGARLAGRAGQPGGVWRPAEEKEVIGEQGRGEGALHGPRLVLLQADRRGAAGVAGKRARPRFRGRGVRAGRADAGPAAGRTWLSPRAACLSLWDSTTSTDGQSVAPWPPQGEPRRAGSIT